MPANMTTEKMGSTKPCMKCPPNSMTNELTICQCERFIIVLSQTYNIFMNFVFFSLFVISLMISTSKLLFLFIHVSIKKIMYLQQLCWSASYKCPADLQACLNLTLISLFYHFINFLFRFL